VKGENLYRGEDAPVHAAAEPCGRPQPARSAPRSASQPRTKALRIGRSSSVDGKVVGAEKLVADFESRALSVSERILEPLGDGVPGTLVHTRPAPVSPSSYCCMFASRLPYPTTPHLANSRSDRARQPLPLPPPSRACPAGMRSRPVLNNRRPLIATVASRAPRRAVPHTLHRPAAHAAREANRDPFARATPCPCHRPAACVRPPCAHEHPRTPANTPANTREPPETHERPERPETLDKFWTIILTMHPVS